MVTILGQDNRPELRKQHPEPSVASLLANLNDSWAASFYLERGQRFKGVDLLVGGFDDGHPHVHLLLQLQPLLLLGRSLGARLALAHSAQESDLCSTIERNV